MHLRKSLFLSLTVGVTLAAGVALASAEKVIPPIETPTPSFGEVISDAGTFTVPSTSPAAPPPPIEGAPPLLSSFESLSFTDNPTVNGGYLFIPPDPIGAAGPLHVVNIDNCAIQWYTKAGVLQNFQSLQGFFTPLGAVNFLYDPKVIYDQHADRFVAIALEQRDIGVGDPVNTSRILIAVSKTSDPNGGWWFHAVNSNIATGGTQGWADYPGLALDENAVYITANIFQYRNLGGAYLGTRLWIVHKNWYAGPDNSATVTVHDAQGLSGAVVTTMQPTHLFGPSPGSTGTWLFAYSGLSDGTSEYVELTRVDNPLGAPVFTNFFVNCGDLEGPSFPSLPDAPQLGAAKAIEVNDRRALQAVWRDGHLYGVTTILPNAGADVNQTTAHWFNINTATNALADQGNIGAEDLGAGTYTFFPSVAVNSHGDLGVGFSACNQSIYAGAYYTFRTATDPFGTVQPTGTLAAGLDYYVRTFTTGSTGRNRWGDYSGTCVDPADDCTFWIHNEYAITRGTVTGTEDGRWGTRWGSFAQQCGPVPVKLAAFGVERSGDAAIVSWTVTEAVDHLGFDVYRDDADGRVQLNTGLLYSATGEYAFEDPSAPRGGADYLLAELSRDGQVAWHGPVHLDASNVDLTARVVLGAAHPNPMIAATSIRFALPAEGNVNLAVYDAAGRHVAQIADGAFSAGDHTVTWNGLTASGARAAAGFYVIRLETQNEVRTQKVVVAR